MVVESERKERLEGGRRERNELSKFEEDAT